MSLKLLRQNQTRRELLQSHFIEKGTEGEIHTCIHKQNGWENVLIECEGCMYVCIYLHLTSKILFYSTSVMNIMEKQHFGSETIVKINLRKMKILWVLIITSQHSFRKLAQLVCGAVFFSPPQWTYSVFMFRNKKVSCDSCVRCTVFDILIM